MNLEQLVDRFAVEAVMYRFAEAIDTCNFEQYRSVFTDEIDVDYSSYRAGSIGRMNADTWVDRVRRLFPGLNATQHMISNVRVTLIGDAAAVQAYVRADHVLRGHPGGDVFTVAGEYDDRLIRTPDGWRIVSKKLTVRWTEGDPELMVVAAQKVTHGQSVRG